MSEGQQKFSLGPTPSESEATKFEFDHELAAIRRIYDALAALPAEARSRILRAVLVLMEIRPSELKE